MTATPSQFNYSRDANVDQSNSTSSSSSNPFGEGEGEGDGDGSITEIPLYSLRNTDLSNITSVYSQAAAALVTFCTHHRPQVRYSTVRLRGDWRVINVFCLVFCIILIYFVIFLTLQCFLSTILTLSLISLLSYTANCHPWLTAPITLILFLSWPLSLSLPLQLLPSPHLLLPCQCLIVEEKSW